jgi:hypothetical protein
MSLQRAMLPFLGLIPLAIVAGSVPAQQPANPAPPEKFKAFVRYYIPSARDQHVLQYKEMVEYLDKIGFEFQPKLKPFPNTDYENRQKNVLTGLVPSSKALRCLDNPSVAQLLLLPADYQVPEDPAQPVRVRLELASRLPAHRQFVLANQVRVLLKQFDFHESTGYDHHGYTGQPFTRLVGTLPAEYLQSLPAEFGKQPIDQVPTMVKDLRTQPTGWFTPSIERESLPDPVRDMVPIVVTEVLPEPEPAKDLARAEKRGQFYLDKISDDLWAMVVSKDDDIKVVRVEIVLAFTPPAGDESYRALLNREASTLIIEGRLGPMVTGLLRVTQASSLAGLSQVSAIRLARPALVHADPSLKFPADNARVLEQSGLAALHQRGARGQGIRIGIIDSDFRGYKDFVKNGKLPKGTRLVDLTTAYNPDMYGDPEVGDDKAIGHGTHCALAAVLAAPDADVTLIRIDPASPPQLAFVARVIEGGPSLDDNMERRFDELRAMATSLSNRQAILARERQPILDNFEDDIDFRREYQMLGSTVRGWLFTAREWHIARSLELDRDRKSFWKLEDRFARFYNQVRDLKGIDVVCTSLVWNAGYPLAGISALSRWFDETPNRRAMWLVSAGNTHGQTWTGPYRDVDRNGIMEFAAPQTKLSAGSWTRELNFLAWQPHQAPQVLEIPPGAKVRVTMQWREPHDPSLFWRPGGADRYLKPLADMYLTALLQRDPTGKTLPADDFEVLGRSSVSALRIDNQPNGSTYEQAVDFTVAKGGRVAIQVERTLPERWEFRKDPQTGRLVLVEMKELAASGIRPVGSGTLPALETVLELMPRIFVEVTDPKTFGQGRVVFRNYQTNQGSIPIQADAQRIVGVGAASLANEPEPYTAAGAPGTLWNVLKPNILTYDGLQLAPEGSGSAYGASLSTPFAAGLAASLLSGGSNREQLQCNWLKQQGCVLGAQKSKNE